MMCLILTWVWSKKIFVGMKIKKELWKTKLTILLETTCQGNFWSILRICLYLINVSTLLDRVIPNRMLIINKASSQLYIFSPNLFIEDGFLLAFSLGIIPYLRNLPRDPFWGVGYMIYIIYLTRLSNNNEFVFAFIRKPLDSHLNGLKTLGELLIGWHYTTKPVYDACTVPYIFLVKNCLILIHLQSLVSVHTRSIQSPLRMYERLSLL